MFFTALHCSLIRRYCKMSHDATGKPRDNGKNRGYPGQKERERQTERQRERERERETDRQTDRERVRVHV